MSGTPAGGRVGRRPWRRLALLALPALLAVFAGLAVIYSAATPIFEGPDEIWHFAFASYLADGGGLPVLSAAHPNLLLRNAAHPPLYFWPLAALIAPIDRSDFPNRFHFNLASPSITPGSHSDRPNLLTHGRNEDFPYRQSVLAVHLGRLWSILLGVITLLGVWSVARQLAPGDTGWLALAATATAAFIPQFVYGSAIINNDALAGTGGAWTLAALLALMRRRQARWAVLSGLALGLTLLSKIGMVAMAPLPVAALVFANIDLLSPAQRTRDQFRSRIRWVLSSAVIIYGMAAAIAGWWYVRNWLLYGDPLAWQIWQVLAGVGRPTPTLDQFLSDMLGLFGTFWADFGLRVDHQWAWVFTVLVLMALVGWGRRLARKDWAQIDGPGLLLAATAFALLLASAVRYSLEITDIHGRLLYPTIAAVAFALAGGLAGWGRRLGRWLVTVTAAGLFVTTALVPFLVIYPAYARPVLTASQLPADVTPSGQSFGGRVELVGYRLLTPRPKPAQSVHLVTYWRTLAPGPSPIGDLHANMALVEPDGRSLGHSEVLLGSSVYPSSEWVATDLIAADFVLAPVQTDLPAVAAIWLSIRGATLEPLQAGSGSQLVLGRVALSGAQVCTPTVPLEADFGGLMRLAGYAYTAGHLTLCWRAEQAMALDYTVFIHIVDSGGQVLGNGDGQPRAGLYPTSAWVPGETVNDVHSLTLPPGASLRLGVYRLDTGERLGLVGSDQSELLLSP